ncbi:MAG: Rap1a/Tai family immunity protein [Aestuariibacter sp.]
MRNVLIKFIVSLAFLIPSTSMAIVKSAEELQNSCKEAKQQQTYRESSCYHFIGGFLQGSLLTDSSIMQDIRAMEGYSARAFRTRVGTERKWLPDTFLAEFCLPESYQIETVIEKLINDLIAPPPSTETAGELVYRVLKKDYPC